MGPFVLAVLCHVLLISIHPPPARWDTIWLHCQYPIRNFNPPTSCEVGPSTLSFIWLITHFNPPTSCEVGHACLAVVIHVVVISIHPPPARWDAALMGHADASMTFQSTHLLRGGTRLERDAMDGHVFQSTHLLRGGTPLPKRYWFCCVTFQSTHLLRGGTPPASDGQGHLWYFNPPTSCEVGPAHGACAAGIADFNPPTSCEVGRDCELEGRTGMDISIHPPPARWDMCCCPYTPLIWLFQSTHLLRGGTHIRQ